MGKELQTLPDDCWELIFRKVQGTDLGSISLVCKHFLSISNVCHNCVVTIYSSNHTILPRLCARFKNINKIFIWVLNDITLRKTLFELASSRLNLQILVFESCLGRFPIPKVGRKELGSLAMKNLNYLHCLINFHRLNDDTCLNDDTLSVIASSMSHLKVLYMGHICRQQRHLPRVSDRGIEILAASLSQLEEIDISGSTLLSDDSFVALSSKCRFLRVVKADRVPKISRRGIDYVLGHSLHLEYLSCELVNFEITYEEAMGSIGFSKKINLAKKLRISRWQHTNVHGLIAFLTGHPSLTCLEIECNYQLDFISDNFIADLCPYLSNMKSICFIGGMLNLGRSSFLNLAKSCLSLEEFRVENYMNKPLFIWVSSEPYSLDDDSGNGAEQKIRRAYRRSSGHYYV